MGKKLLDLIEEFMNGNNLMFFLIVEKFMPLINKYTRLLFKEERADSEAEFILALLEALYNLEYYQEEGQCIIFISNALKHKYLELYRKSRNKFDNEVFLNYEQSCSLISFQAEYNEIELLEDCQKYLNGYDTKQRHIFYACLFQGISIYEAAAWAAVSRQYAHRIKKKICQEIKEDYFEK